MPVVKRVAGKKRFRKKQKQKVREQNCLFERLMTVKCYDY